MKKIRWGILGCARIAERALIPAFRAAANADLLGIAARDEKRARAWAAKHAIEKAHKDYASLLEDPDIDAVYVPLPNHLHAEWTIRAAAAGKHVLCEKPLALTEAEVRTMFQACDRAGVLLMEAFMYRFHPQFERTLRLVRTGRIGDIRAFRSAFTFRISSGKEDYRWYPEMGGGALYDIGCYPVSAARTIFGEEPSSVFARARFHPESGIKGRAFAAEVKGRAFGSPLARGLYRRASTAEMDPRAKPGAPSAVDPRVKPGALTCDVNTRLSAAEADPQTKPGAPAAAPAAVDAAMSLLLEFPGGRHALLDCALDTQFESWLEIAGSEGRITLPRAYTPKHFDVPIQILRGDEEKTILVPAANHYVRMIEHFGDCIRRGLSPRYALEDAAGSARVIDAAFKSLAAAQPIVLP